MFNNILIIGCGLIGSSILKASIQKKISKNFFVFEKSKKYRSIIKKFNKKIINRIILWIEDFELKIYVTKRIMRFKKILYNYIKL